MPESPSPRDIRNIALAGQAGSGKSALVSALLAYAGRTPAKGNGHGSDAAEGDQHSTRSGVASFDWEDVRVNLIDTPGLSEFQGASLSILPAAETVAVVVSAQSGIDTTTRRMMDWSAERGLCRLLIVNKIDAEDADLRALLHDIRNTFGNEVLALNLPAGGGSRVVDCFFEPAGEADIVGVQEAHAALVDQVVEVDEELMTLYLEQGEELSPEQLHKPFEQALRAGHLVPLCFVSARSGAGIEPLLDVFSRLMPNPLEGNPPPFVRREQNVESEFAAVPDPERHVLAHVVKLEHDPFLGKIATFRVHQGVVTRNSRLFVGDGRKPFKLGNLYRFDGRERVEAESCGCGDIGAVGKVDEIHFDAVLHDSHDEDHISLRPVVLPTPVFGLALQATRHGDEQKLSEVLVKLSDEDPGLQLAHNAVTNETVLWGYGEWHLRVALEQMRERYGLQVETSTPAIAYRETITAPAEGHCRHKKQTGGAGQFGEVFLRVAPSEPGKGLVFVNEIKGGAIPASLLPAVEKGVREAMASGAIAGYPMQDVAVTVYDGKTHPVDSKEVAFVIAARKAFLDAVRKAGPIILEPVAELEIEAPAVHMGDISGDLSARRGRILDTSSQGERITIQAAVPLAELDGFPSHLKALTGGEGAHSLSFSHYAAVPEPVQQRLRAAYRPAEEDA